LIGRPVHLAGARVVRQALVVVADVVGKAVLVGIADLIGMRPVMGQTRSPLTKLQRHRPSKKTVTHDLLLIPKFMH
jgi:hypothetical protein